jgi:hypothetical protein
MLLGLIVALLQFTPAAYAHESRSAYLEIKELPSSEFLLVWRTPTSDAGRLPVALELPAAARDTKPPSVMEFSGARVERRYIDFGPRGVESQRIQFKGLESTIADVLVRVQMADGRSWTTIVRPSQPWLDVAQQSSSWQLAWTFLIEGIRHILFGPDHLLFVLGLLLIVSDWWTLVKTVTAFTIAHSITLALATLGLARAPVDPLNAAIALSILFLGPEIIRVWRGQTSFTIRHPWVVAFLFGLVHGFGLAGALTSAGLPASELPLTLLSFNVGVELGQIGFIAGIYLVERSFRQLEIHWPRWVELLPGYAVGSLGAFWTIQRTCMLLGFIR